MFEWVKKEGDIKRIKREHLKEYFPEREAKLSAQDAAVERWHKELQE